MTAIDDRWPEERFYFRSDHYNFARKGVPILFFFNGVHPDYHQVTDSPDKIDSEKESRILRLLYYLGREVGDAPQRPKWNPESYREIVDERPVIERWRRGILRAMADTIADFNAFRTRMNELILGAGNLTINRFFALDNRTYEAGRAGHQDEGDAGAGLVARAPLRRLRHLPRDPLPRGRCHARGVPGDLLGGTGGGREHRDSASAAGDGAAGGAGSDSESLRDYQRHPRQQHPRDDQHRPHRLRAAAPCSPSMIHAAPTGDQRRHAHVDGRPGAADRLHAPVPEDVRDHQRQQRRVGQRGPRRRRDRAPLQPHQSGQADEHESGHARHRS